MLGNMPLQENMVFVSGRIDQKVSQMSDVQLDQNVILDSQFEPKHLNSVFLVVFLVSFFH